MPVLVGEAPITGATLSNSPTIDVGPAGKNRDTRLPTNSTFSEVPEVQGQNMKMKLIVFGIAVALILIMFMSICRGFSCLH